MVKSTSSVRVIYGAYDLYAEAAGLSVARVLATFQDILSEGDDVTIYVNGKQSLDSVICRGGDRIEFMRDCEKNEMGQPEGLNWTYKAEVPLNKAEQRTLAFGRLEEWARRFLSRTTLEPQENGYLDILVETMSIQSEAEHHGRLRCHSEMEPAAVLDARRAVLYEGVEFWEPLVGMSWAGLVALGMEYIEEYPDAFFALHVDNLSAFLRYNYALESPTTEDEWVRFDYTEMLRATLALVCVLPEMPGSMVGLEDEWPEEYRNL